MHKRNFQTRFSYFFPSKDFPSKRTFHHRIHTRKRNNSPNKSADVNARWWICCWRGWIGVVLDGDPTASGFWMIDPRLLVLVGVMFPMGLGAKMFSMVKADVGEDMVAEELGLETSRGLNRISSELNGLLENVLSRPSISCRLPVTFCSSLLFNLCCKLSGE